MDVTLLDYAVALLRLPAESIYWTDSKAFVSYESFTH